MRNNSSPDADSIWDECRLKREVEAARKKQIARRVRALARELGAKAGSRDGEWALKCPHCSLITFISEQGRTYRVEYGDCEATRLIMRRMREIL